MTLTINGVIATSGHFSAPRSGPWFLDAEMVDDAPLSGRVTVRLVDQELSGTVVPEESGTFGLRRSVRIVGGANGWQRLIRARGYHNDAGVSAELVARDAARDCGETIGAFAARAARLGSDFARAAGPASRAIDLASGGYAWWVDYAGVTQVAAARAPHTPKPGDYEILSFDPRCRVATIAVDSLDAVRIGSVLSERLDTPETVSALEVSVVGGPTPQVRMRAWCGTAAPATSDIGDMLQAIVRRTVDSRLLGLYRYRVVNMAGDRVNVQAVRVASGVPDLLAIRMTPGVAGAHAVLAKGAEVRVAFIDGDPASPEIVGFAGKSDAGHVPESLTLCGSEFQAARQGDMVEIPTLGLTVTFNTPPGASTIPLPMTTLTPYFLSFNPLIPPTPILSGPAYGFISTGSPRVRL